MEEIYIAIIAVSLVVVILSLGIILAIVNYKTKQEVYLKEKKALQSEFDNQLLLSQVEVQEATYLNLAKELHDNVGQLLSSSKMLLAIVQRKLDDPPEMLAIAEATLAKAILELRALSKSMDKEWLLQFELIENLQTEIDRINGSGQLSIQLLHDNKLPLSSEKQIVLFRIVQEAIQNIIKHAQAANITITISLQETMLKISVADDGKGIDDTSGKGLGMKNMIYRTNLLGGEIAWTKPAHGSCVHINIPFKETKS